MTSVAAVLIDAFERVQGVVHSAASGLTAGQLVERPGAESNTIAWLLWHLTRVQDDHIADAFGQEQVWTAAGWADRFGLPFSVSEIGYGQSSAEVGAVRVDSSDLLIGYHDAVHQQTAGCLERLTDADLDRVVDEGWDPPVTLGARLVSVISDDLQHAGQAAYVRGLVG